jgi:hypothetical protein
VAQRGHGSIVGSIGVQEEAIESWIRDEESAVTVRFERNAPLFGQE